MMVLFTRRKASAKEQTTFQFLIAPTISVLVNVVLVIALSQITNEEERLLHQAEVMAGMVSSTSITIVTLTFSLTVLSIQIAAQTYSPRLLDEFLKDPIANIAVAINLGAYAYAYTMTYFLFDPMAVPHVAIHLLSVHMAAVSLMFVIFIHYFINGFRLESILHKAAEASWEAAKELEEQNGKSRVKKTDDLPIVPSTAFKVLADTSGYLARYHLEEIVNKAKKLGACVRYHPNIGEFVAEGSLLAYVWELESCHGDDNEDSPPPKNLGLRQRILKTSIHARRHKRSEYLGDQSNHNSQDDVIIEELLGAWISKGVELTTGRSGDLDVLLGVQQLADVAVKALSPAINDPMTAVQSIDYLSSLFGRLAHLDFYIGCVRDKRGVVRCSSPRRSFVYLLSMLDEIRFYGATDLQINYRLIRFYGDLGAVMKRLGKQDRLLAILAQLEQCMICARKNFEPDSSERNSLEALYKHMLDMISTSDKPVMARGESIEQDLTILETTFEKPTPQFLQTLDENYNQAILPLAPNENGGT